MNSQDLMPQEYAVSPSVGEQVSAREPASRTALKHSTVSDATRRILNRLCFGALDLACFFAITAIANAIHPVLTGLEIPVVALVLLLSNSIVGLHSGAVWNSTEEVRLSTIVISILVLAFGVSKFMGDSSPLVFLGLASLWIALTFCLPVARAALRGVLSKTNWWPAPTIVFGDGELALNVFRRLKSKPSLGLNPICIFEEAKRDSIQSLIRSNKVSWFVFAAEEHRGEVRELASYVSRRVPNTLVVQDALTLPTQHASVFDTVGISGIQYKGIVASGWLLAMKRATDVAVAVMVMLLLSPLFLCLCALVRFTSRGPIFYGQERIGKHGRVFRAWKFRTMVPNADQVLKQYLNENEEMRREWEADHKLKNDPRVTWIGSLLRKTSLDELPQIWNVIVGEMSLVGPRPIVQAEADKYGNALDLYLRVTPGVTGLWQVSGRNNTTYDQRVELDSYYVRNWSLWLDICILVVTIRVVLLREGAY